MSLLVRPRRLRRHPALRRLIAETNLTIHDLILPLFIKDKLEKKVAISSMPGHFQLSLNDIEQEIEEIVKLGISTVLLFGIPAFKDECGSASYHHEGIIQRAIAKIRQVAPHLLIMTDVCLCEYTSHGHCGVIDKVGSERYIDNDKTLPLLVKQAVSHARAGADIVAPSAMMDGMVKAIRQGLDEANFTDCAICSYSVKYQSAFYGPFRQAAEGAPSFGDRSSYQMDPSNGSEALLEAGLDVDQGADMLMVKPAGSYLDVIYRVKARYAQKPLGAYHTSGEFSMIKAAAEKGWLDEKSAALEITCAIKRAGADFIISYYAKELARWCCIE